MNIVTVDRTITFVGRGLPNRKELAGKSSVFIEDISFSSKEPIYINASGRMLLINCFGSPTISNIFIENSIDSVVLKGDCLTLNGCLRNQPAFGYFNTCNTDGSWILQNAEFKFLKLEIDRLSITNTVNYFSIGTYGKVSRVVKEALEEAINSGKHIDVPDTIGEYCYVEKPIMFGKHQQPAMYYGRVAICQVIKQNIQDIVKGYYEYSPYIPLSNAVLKRSKGFLQELDKVDMSDSVNSSIRISEIAKKYASYYRNIFDFSEFILGIVRFFTFDKIEAESNILTYLRFVSSHVNLSSITARFLTKSICFDLITEVFCEVELELLSKSIGIYCVYPLSSRVFGRLSTMAEQASDMRDDAIRCGIYDSLKDLDYDMDLYKLNGFDLFVLVNPFYGMLFNQEFLALYFRPDVGYAISGATSNISSSFSALTVNSENSYCGQFTTNKENVMLQKDVRTSLDNVV